MEEREKKLLLLKVKKFFEIEEFRESQAEIIDRILKEEDCLALMPTGGGKSLCYQYPALEKPGLTIVVSPLIALMEDQVKSLLERGLPAGRLHREMVEEERSDTMKKVLKGEIKLLYLSPEKLLSPKFINYSKKLEISLLVVDEAHSISIFGYGFRPSYLNLARYFKQIRKRPPIAAFTATAPKYVQSDIIKLLGLKVSPATNSLKYQKNHEIIIKKIEKTNDKLAELISYLTVHQKEAGIIYCTTVENVKLVTQFLKQRNFKARAYYSDLKQEKKDGCYNAFLAGRCKIVVATNAFGMGIDKKNVRYVIHFDMPRDIESYVQEMGRAGRDGEFASCLLLYHEDDGKRLRELVKIKDKSLLKEDKLAEFERKLRLERLEHMISFLENGSGKKNKILQEEISNYFETNRLTEDLKKEAEEVREFLLQNMNRPEKLSMNLTRIAGCIKKKEYDTGVFNQLPIGGKGREQRVSFKIDKELSYFDICVADAVYSLYYAGKEKIYIKNILELLSGDRKALLKKGGTEGRKSLAEEMKESLEKMAETQITIDRTNAKIGFGREDVITGKFLCLERTGKSGYLILETPILYRYAELTNGQIAGVKLAYLKIPGLPNSKENLMLRHYIVNGIKIRKPFINKREKGINRSINIKNALAVLGIELPKDTSARNRKLRNIREKIEKILEHERNLGLITDYYFSENGESVKLDFFE